MPDIATRPALAAAVALLKRAGLPTADLTDESMEAFFFAGDPAAPLGIVGVELSPPHAMLRSLVVGDPVRSTGMGSRLLAHAEAHARSTGVRSIFLLTTTAERFFIARGYQRLDRSEAPGFIRASREFSALCPASAAFMVKNLQE